MTGYVRWPSFRVVAGSEEKGIADSGPVRPGTRNLYLRLRPARRKRRVRCRLLLDSGCPAPWAFLLRFQGTGENQGLRRAWRLSGPGSDTGEIPLEAGPWKVDVFSGGTGEILKSLGEVFVPGGEGVYAPPELNPVDLRGAVRWVSLRIRTDRRSFSRLKVRMNGKVYETRGMLDPGRGVLYVFSRKFPVRLEVEAPGGKRKAIPSISKDMEVVL